MANSITGGKVSTNSIKGGTAFSPEMIQQFMQFKRGFKGDPKQAVMGMLSNGQISNPQLQQAIQMAKQFQSFI